MNKKTLGILLIVGPFLLLVITLVGYGIATFVLTAGGGQGTLMAAQIVNMVLGLIGIVSLIGIVPCFIIGLVMILKKQK